MRVLALNGGSSSFKACLRELGEPLPERAPEPLWEASAEWSRCPGLPPSAEQVLRPMLENVRNLTPVDLVGHRVVHGGSALRQTAWITPAVKFQIAGMAEFAPEHNRLELEAMETVERALGAGVPQVAVFDTAFHADLPLSAALYPLPYEWAPQGIRRYGFHGISHQYASGRAAAVLGAELAALRVVTCHLGNGASLAAIRGGRSVDTTMGFTPLEGLMMGSRCGSIDPGILTYLARRRAYTAAQLDRILNRESGLKGVSGISADMREIVAAMQQGHERARLAFELYAHRLCRELGGMLASLGGLDLLVFTGGIGENCAPLREIVCRRFAFLGIRLDDEKNERSPRDEDVAAADSAVRVVIVRADEEWQMMRECVRLAARGCPATAAAPAT